MIKKFSCQTYKSVSDVADILWVLIEMKEPKLKKQWYVWCSSIENGILMVV